MVEGSGVSRSGTAVDEDAVDALIRLAEGKRRIVAFTGAGISTESGIPDYRGPNGVWTTGKIPRIDDFRTNSDTQRQYWEGRRGRYAEMLSIEPNVGHLALLRLEGAGLLYAIITQNIDGLHLKAGNDPERVHELHGTTHRIRCMDCGRQWSASAIHGRLIGGESVPACELCGGPLRTATVLFGEALPQEPLRKATEAARAADLFLVVGSSLVVKPAAQLPALAKHAGAALAIVNRTETPLDEIADVRVFGESGPTLDALVNALIRNRTKRRGLRTE